jgi:hypothetical protein
MANSITAAFSSFNTIMQRELALLQVKMLEHPRNLKQQEPVAPAGPALSININGLIDKKIAELEERIMNKITTMCQVRTVTCALSDAVEKIDVKVKAIEEEIAATSSVPTDIQPVTVNEEIPTEAEEKVEEEAEEKVEIEAEEEAEEETSNEAEDAETDAEDEEEEELTEFRYKGKTYFMDSDSNVYGLDANGELIEDPIGTYDETTRKITFNN